MYSACILLSFALLASAQTFNAPNIIPNVWSAVGSPLFLTPLQFTLVLHSADPAGLETRMQQIASNIGSPWLTEDEVASYVGATPQTKSTVEAAIKTIPGATYSFNTLGDMVTVSTNVGHANRVSISSIIIQVTKASQKKDRKSVV